VTRCDGSNGRINGAFAASEGASCLVTTVTQESGIPVTHYLQVDFAGFLELVDAVGGVPVFLEQPMVDAAAGVNLPQGCNLLDGRQALGFVRARQVDSDLGRVARQQRFVAALADQVASPATLLNPVRLFQVTTAAAGALTADTGLGVVDLLRLARAARGLAAGGLATYTVPTTGDTIDGASVQVPTDEAEDLYASFRDGSVLDVPAGDVEPSDVTVDVLNGAGIEGLAARGRDALTERGFRVGEVGNAETQVERTVVRHAPGFEAAAQLVAAQFPGTPVEPGGAGATGVALVVGPDAPDLFQASPAPAAPTEPGPPTPGAVGAGPAPADCG
jgi:LCP family protein required for cell wall assembly